MNNNSPFSTNERKIFVANLPRTISEDQFRAHFTRFGPVESANFVRNESQQPNGCGFIVFADIRSVAIVLSRSRDQNLPMLVNRMPCVRRYDPQHEQWSRNIILSDLPPRSCYKRLTDILSTFGPIAKLDVGTPGIGYATFKHKWDAQKCVHNGAFLLDGRKVKVAFDKGDRNRSETKTQSNNSTSSNEPKLFVKHLHRSISKNALQRYFRKYGSNTAVITQSKDNCIFAHVSFAEESALERALGDDHYINGFKLTVDRYKGTMRSNSTSSFNQKPAGAVNRKLSSKGNQNSSSAVNENASSATNQNASSESNPVKKLISLCSQGRGVISILSFVIYVFSGYPLIGIIALFLLFIYLHNENAYGLKDQKYILHGSVLLFIVAMFFTAYLTDSFGFQEFLNAKLKMYYTDRNHHQYRRQNW